MSRSTPPALELKGITKKFGSVVANDRVDFDVVPGEVHALLGENGAGKSTLIKIVSGVFPPNRGRILIDGVERKFGLPEDARRAGVATIYQELLLFPELTVAENIFMGHAPRGSGGRLDWRAMRERAETLLASAVDDPNDPFSLVKLDGDDLAAEPSRLVDEALTVPLFGGRRAIRVRAGLARQGAPSPALDALLGPETLPSATDAELRTLTVPVGVVPSVPANPLHPRSAVYSLLRLLPSAVELPGCPEPPRPDFAARLDSFVTAVSEFAGQ